jgi:hypothetical protein
MIAVPITVAVLQETITTRFEGKAAFPEVTKPPETDPTVETLKFSLWQSEGVALPSTITNLNYDRVFIDDAPKYMSPDISFFVRNDGNVPIKVSFEVDNVIVPSNVEFQIDPDDDIVVPVGQSKQMLFWTAMIVESGKFTPGESFSYSFDIVSTATKD